MEDNSVLTVLTLAALLMAWIALRRTKALSVTLKATQARLAVLEAGPTSAAVAAPSAASPEPPELPEPSRRPSLAATSAPVPAAAGFTSEWLAGRGLVWVGALALGLAGLFLIRYSIDNGLFGPLARVIAGLALGAGLIAAGEWLARRGPPVPVPADDAGARLPPVTGPTALIGGGVSTLFTACYGAYAIYGLIDPLPAFVLLAGIAFATLLLALRHGPVIALVGLVGALVVPALVATKDDPAPIEFFLYLAAVVATGLAVVRLRGWWWLGWVALGGAVGWSLLWLSFHQDLGDTLVTGGFALGVLLMLPVGLHLADTPMVDTPSAAADRSGRWGTPPPLQLMLAATAGAMLILFLGLRLEDYGTPALVWLGLAGGFAQWAGWRQPKLIALPWLTAVTALLAYLMWLFPLPQDTGWVGVVEGTPAGHLPQALIEPAFLPYSLTGLAIAALFGLGGWVGVQRNERGWPWSLLSVVAPLAVLIIAYGYTAGSTLHPPWAAAALGLAGALLAATSTLHRRLDHAPGLALPVALYAAGVIAAITLAMVMMLHDFWLTVAISVQLPALAWIERRVQVPEMRRIALVLAVAVLVRLLLNPGITGYDIGSTPIVNGLLYGYGLPLVAFRAAQILFRDNRRRGGGSLPPAHLPAGDLLDDLLEAGWIGLLVLLVSLQLRHLIGGGTITALSYGALEQGLQVAWWGSLALALMHADRTGRPGRILGWAWRGLAALTLGHVVIFAGIDSNPLWQPFSVGDWPLFNLVTLNYGVPALLAAIAAHQAGRRPWPGIRKYAGIAAIVLAWLFVTLSVRQAFQGPILADASPSDAEWYAYSAVWLAYGGGLLALGLRLDLAALRSASMAVIIATVIKVFVFDMSTLAGLLRVASFLGLGLALVLIGWVHQAALNTLKPKPPQNPVAGPLRSTDKAVIYPADQGTGE
jgi:uncharacterized membrane protein